MLLPHHEPEVTDSVLERSLAQNVVALCSLQFDEIGIDVIGVDVLPLEDDPRVVVRIHIPVPVKQ